LGGVRAEAANCFSATEQGATGLANWQSYCLLDFSGYNDSAARSTAGQAMSYTLPDGTLITFTLRTFRAAIRGAASPSWGGLGGWRHGLPRHRRVTDYLSERGRHRG
jgi:hypothetical protein